MILISEKKEEPLLKSDVIQDDQLEQFKLVVENIVCKTDMKKESNSDTKQKIKDESSKK